MESILTSIKKLLGIAEEYTHFDSDIIMHINAVFMTLNQIGIGPSSTFSIRGNTETWYDFLKGRGDMEAVKTYVYFKVRLAFDPPTNSSHQESINRSISEIEWRLHWQTESNSEEV